MFQLNRLAGMMMFAAGLAVLAGTAHAQQSHPPVEAFGQLPAISDPQLSPDGKYFATIQSLKGRPTALIYEIGAPVGTATNPVVIPSSSWFIARIAWAKNDRLIIFLKKSEIERYQDDVSTKIRAMAVGADGKNPVTLMKNQWTYGINAATSGIVDLCPGDPDNVLAVLYGVERPDNVGGGPLTSTEYQGHLDLMKVNVRTGDASRLMQGTDDTQSWLTDGRCNVVGRVDQVQDPKRDHLYLYKDGSWKEAGVFDVTPDKGLEVEGLTPDGMALVLMERNKDTLNTLVRFDIATGQKTPLFSVPNYDVDGALHDRWTKQVIGARYTDDSPKIVYFDPAKEAMQRGLENAFPGLTVAQVSSNLTDDKLIIMAEGPRTPPTYYYFDRGTHRVTPISPTYPGLDAADLGEMKPYPYKARDGLDIPAYLTLPPGKVAKNLPTVIFPHGGPDARDAMGFDWWAQFMANRGYAVLQPNYRGSTGYGHKFTEAGLHQWGLKMQDDISDGVKKLIADGIADPKRICIVGWSYGGYATLAGLTLSPELYACAVAGAGVSDLPTILGTELQLYGGKKGAYYFWQSRIGSVFDDGPRLNATSPAQHVADVRAPLLLLHGENDTTVRINQSEIMDKAMLKAGKTVEFIRLEGGEDHYLNLPATRIKVLTETERFLKKYIGD